jgi:hypothetical protein
VAEKLPEQGDAILVCRKDRPVLLTAAQANPAQSWTDLGPQQYRLKTLPLAKRKLLLIVGGDDAGTLYGAYRLAELMGVRFYLDGDVLPDKPIPLALPPLDQVEPPSQARRPSCSGLLPSPLTWRLAALPASTCQRWAPCPYRIFRPA